jgi:hypothetical protein
MIVRTRLSPESALELNHKFQKYLHAFGETQDLAKELLLQLGNHPRKDTQ